MSPMSTTEVLSDKNVKQHFHYGFASPTATMTPTPMEARPNQYTNWAQAQISPLLELSENWDGYGASAPNQIAIALASGILAALGQLGYMQQPYVTATRTGGVALLWERDGEELEICCQAPGRLESLYRNNSNNQSSKGTSANLDRNAPEFFTPLRLFFQR